MWKHKNCGGQIQDELAYSDAENDYYFARCQKCGESPETKDREFLMTIEFAVSEILGTKLSSELIEDMSLEWAVVVAMSQATMADDANAISTIRQWNAERKIA